MKILRCIATANPAQGGPWTGLVASATIHSKLGHETHLVTFDTPDQTWVQHCPFQVFATGPALLKNKFAPNYVPWLRKNARNYDAIFVHGLWNYSSVGAWYALRGSGIPYSVFLHGSLDPWFKTVKFKGAVKDLYFKFIEQKVLEDAFTVLFTANEEMRLAQLAFPSRPYHSTVIRYGINSPPEKVDKQANAFAQRVPALQGRPYILFLSRIHTKKGCDLLIDAFIRLASDYPEVDLVIAGPDQSSIVPQLKHIASSSGLSDRVHWPGPLSGDEKWGAFYGCEAFILPSHTENFGLAVVEALACGAPVLISDKVNIWKDIQLAGAGIVNADTLEGTLNSLNFFLSLPKEKKNKMKESAISVFGEKFHVEKSAEDLIEVSIAMMSNRSSRGLASS